ncbi:protein-glucosylgalactosylhydroxylysine glucosidase-like [Babylonia areolata]|uniref:protein-glucosylgalactosylhydroxylysine glucosidase-like n=1 Tax=Babylonia areolata TaxID=304850 RepID=UPI003FD33305
MALVHVDRLPTENSTGQSRVDFRMMAAIGNGHVATVLYSPVVYMNGLYNGPTIHDVHVRVEGVQVTRSYALDMWRAVFTETIRAEGLEIKVMTYAHQRLVQLLVTEVHVTRTDSSQQELTVMLDRSKMNSTVDLGIKESTQVKDLSGCDTTCMHVYGETHITETESAEIGKIHIFWTDIPSALTLPRDRHAQKWIFFSSYDKEQSKARHSFQKALNLRAVTPDMLLETQEKAWADRWNSGRLDVEGDDDLDTTIHSSLYYILMSLPSDQPELPLGQFFGLSPGSLARGANWTDYQGHVFWDMETWMYPPIAALFPSLARAMLSYRIYGGEGARAKAREHGYEGWQFPWESAFTGYEMTPLICVPCREYEQHITGDVAFAARQFWALTRDARWLQEEGGVSLFANTARFWADRAQFNEVEDRYDINGVMPPDERAEHVNNSIYTNYVAKLNLQMALYLRCVASKLHMVFSQSGQYHPEYEGYDDLDTVVKQADTVMLGYPLGMKMDDQVRRNDLTLYEKRGDPNGPAMTWSMFSVNWLDLGETHPAAVNFNKSYQWYTRKPFNVWTEVKTGMGATNFITGMGGFLQAVLFGYGGFRIELERVTFTPRLPPGTTRFRITGVDYLGATFDLLITGDTVLFVVRQTDREFPLELRMLSSGTTWSLRAGLELTLERQPFEVYTLNVTDCPLPQGSSCPDVVRGDESKGREPMIPTGIGRVHVTQTGGDRCGDFLQCSRLLQQLTAMDNTVNFYIGDDNRIYQGSSTSFTAGTLKVAMLGDYTLEGISLRQQTLLRRLLKCGMESSSIDPEYKLEFNAERAEDCGTAPCAGNSLHCQLKEWRHWDPTITATTVQRDCSTHIHTPTTLPTPPANTSVTSGCPTRVTCNCPTQRLHGDGDDVSNKAAPGCVFGSSAVLGGQLLLVVVWGGFGW